ncbi:polyamine ABC transporter substrate-binding protein [Pelagibacterium xiamenense]|uniref:polyamine ABC transporter substrate-binding protein n=1 Tax=Pelagibacterium xiamenense TaxID=2901140 RepID=UPI001E5D9E00|nr:polyamine ABC transporter substrate-binding protein [Pelagibacterium xiamenense]MCD7060742.1 polyamine ABC transporter substrate-binding protein [Pelagibacterium xiamenense]
MHKPLLATLGIALLATTSANAQSVNIYNWSDYIAEDTLAKFEAETGITPVYDVFDSNEIVEAKLLAGNSGYDVVVPSGFFLERQIQVGLFQPLDKSLLPNMENLDPRIMEIVETHDPGSEYSVPYMWGTTALGYNVGMVTERLGENGPLESWDLLFDPEIAAQLQDCGIAVLDAPVEIVAAALNYLGLDPNSENADDLAAAEELIASVRPFVRYFHSSQYITDLANGDICLAVGYSGDVFIAADRAAEAGQGNEITYVIPEEGASLWFDMMAIPSDAPNPEAAHAYINFILKPEIAADITNYVWYANPNAASMDMVDPEIAGDPAIFPTEEVMANLYALKSHTPQFDQVLNRAWTRIKTGQ